MTEIRFGHKVRIEGGFWHGYEGIALRFRNDSYLVEFLGSIGSEYVPSEYVASLEENSEENKEERPR